MPNGSPGWERCKRLTTGLDSENCNWRGRWRFFWPPFSLMSFGYITFVTLNSYDLFRHRMAENSHMVLRGGGVLVEKLFCSFFNPAISLYIYYDQYEKRLRKNNKFFFPAVGFQNGGHFDFRAHQAPTDLYNITVAGGFLHGFLCSMAAIFDYIIGHSTKKQSYTQSDGLSIEHT